VATRRHNAEAGREKRFSVFGAFDKTWHSWRRTTELGSELE